MLRRLPLLLVLGILAAGLAHAQGAPKGNLPPHQANLAWTNGVDPTGTTITGSNVYRCQGTCTPLAGTFTLQNPAPLPASTLSFTDAQVTPNTTYTWGVTNLITIPTGTFETPSSNLVTATIPKDVAVAPVLAPVGVQ